MLYFRYTKGNEVIKMKSFEYARIKKKRGSFKMPHIEIGIYDIPLWALPIAPFEIAYDKFDTWYYSNQKWSEEKATKALNYFLPHVLEFVEEDNAYYYCTEWRYSGYEIAKRVPLGMKKWTKKFGYEILYFLKTGYENPDFSKIVVNEYDGTWIKFEKR